MSLFSSLKGAASSFIADVKKGAPKSLGQAVSDVITVSGLAAAGATAVKAAPKIVSVAKSLIPTTVKGKIVAAISTPVVVGILSKDPKAPIRAVSELSKFGTSIGTFTADPSLETAKGIVKESPVITAAATGLGIAALGKGAAGLVGGIAQAQATERVAEAIENQAIIPSGATQTLELPTTPKEISGVSDLKPMTAETQELRKARRRKAKKTALEGFRQTISQSVRVQVGVNAANRKFIKKVMFV